MPRNASLRLVDSPSTVLPLLTESVTRLNEQPGQLLAVPDLLAGAERAVSRLEHLFRRG